MKVIILTRRRCIAIAACILAVILILWVASSTLAQAVSGTKKILPIYAVDTPEKKVALTFDAAWGNEDTQMLIDILGKYNIKATFFVVGEWVDKYPESVKALSDAGHMIQNHSATHPHMPALSRDGMLQEITGCNQKIEALTGQKPTLFRPPYGDYNNTLIEVLKSQNMYCIQWDVDSLDWKDYSADAIQERVVAKTKEGSIILFHNAAKNTPAALPGIIEALLANGYSFSTVYDLIYKDNYTIDHTGRQRAGAAARSSSAPSLPQAATEQ